MKDMYYNDEGINALIQNELNAFIKDYKNTIYAYAIMNKKDPRKCRLSIIILSGLTSILKENTSLLTLSLLGL